MKFLSKAYAQQSKEQRIFPETDVVSNTIMSSAEPMNNQTALHKIAHFPLTKIIVGIIVVSAAVALGKFAGKTMLDKMQMNSELKNAMTGIIAAGMALLSYTLLFRYYEKRPVTELSLTSFWKNAITGFSVGLTLQSLVILVIYLCADYAVIRVNPVSFLLPAFTIALTSAINEEIMVRGIIFRLSEEKLGTVIALIISALLFGLLHMGNKGATIFSTISIAIQAGGLLAAGYIFSRSLWLPVFLHFAWNFAEAGIYGAVISGNALEKSLITSKITGPDVITGGPFGPENSIQATLFCLIAGVIYLWKAKQQNKFTKPCWLIP